MKEYSSREKFEEAAQIRDSIRTIVNNIGRMKVLKEPINTLNAIIIIFDEIKPKEFIGIKNGVLIFTIKYEEEDNFIAHLVKEYFSDYQMDFDLALNIEKIKIIANFLVNQKARYKIIYTKNLTEDELYKKIKTGLMEI
jgi:excinuclease UvrABC nuclease subunit